jgi:hypothetical protein
MHVERVKMKRILTFVMIGLLCLSMFTMLRPLLRAAGQPLVGYWNVDEGSGTVAHDNSGNGNDGILCNDPTWVNGKSGGALSFDGVDDYVNVTENTDLDPHTSNWTISAWLNIAKLSNVYQWGSNYGFVIVGKRQTVYDKSLTLLVHAGTSENSQAKFAFILDGAFQANGAESSLMNVCGWHYVAGVRRGAELFVYVDGVEYGPNNFYLCGDWITAATDVSSTTQIHLGHHGAWQSYYNGTVDEVRIYDRALNLQEIQSCMDPNSIKHYVDDFSVDSGLWTYCDNAYRDNIGKYVVLTDAASYEAGGIWLNESLRSSFTVRFRYWVGNTTGHTRTDGFVFKFFKQIDYSLPHGGYLGFSGLGYGIEFDTFPNYWDPSGNHIALIKDESTNHLAHVDDGRVSDNAWHNVTITVASSSITVDLDSGRILSWNGTLDRTYGGFGFSAATGDAPGFNDKHILDDFSIDSPASQYEISITPATVSTSIGGTTHYAVTVDNQGGITDLFNLSVSGLNSAWIDLSKNSIYLIAGETAEIDLTISVPEDPSAVGAYAFCVFAKESLGVEKNASSQLTVFLNPIITNLEPENNTTIGSTDTLFSWCTSSNASSEVYIKQTGDLAFSNIVSEPGVSHYVSASNLTRNADYLWYAYSETANGNVSSDIRALHVGNGISFAQRNYTFNIQRDYAQYGSVSVTNNDTQPHDLLLEVLNPNQDLIVGFVGPGSVDENLTVTSGETIPVAFNIFAQDAMQRNYTFTIKLTNLGPEQIKDYALVNVNVRQPNINLTLVEESTNPVTLSKTITATNYGDPITDLYIDTNDELAGKVSFKPTVCHANLPTGGSLTFQAIPVLTANFVGFQGLALAMSAGQIIASLQMNFTLPPGKSVYSVTIPRVSIEFSNYYDTDDSPNTNPLPGHMVESYLANGTIMFASQIIVDVCQNGTPAYGANVSLTVWNETGTLWSTTCVETDFTGKAIFMVFGLAGNYSYQAELVDYGIETEKRSFSVDTSSLFEIHPEDITWIDVSDINSTFDLSQNVSRILLDQAPFTFRARKTTIDQNANFTLCLRWDFDKFKYIFVPGSIVNDTIVFETSSIPTGNFSAVVVYYSDSSGLSLSTLINITNTDSSGMYLQGNYTYWQPFPLNSTHYVRLSIDRSVNSRDPAVAFDLYSIRPAGNNLLYNLTYLIGSNETTDKEFRICVDASNNVLYDNTFELALEPWKPVFVSFTIPAYCDNGTLLSEFNATISSGSLFVNTLFQSSIHYICDPRIWVGADWGFLKALLPPPSMAAAEARLRASLTCGIGIAEDIVPGYVLDNLGLVKIIDKEAFGIGKAIGSDGVDYAAHADDMSRTILQVKLIAEGIGATVGALLGAAGTVETGPGMLAGAAGGAYAGYVCVATLWDTGSCLYNYWTTVQAEATESSNGIGQSYPIHTSSWYCTNTPVVTTTFTISSCVSRTASPELNVDPAALIVHFALPWPKGTYRNHEIHLLINNIEIGNLTNTIPEGYYIFPFNASILNYASEGTAQNTVTLRMENLNMGHYIVSTDMEIVLHLKKLVLAVVASNQTEADSIVEQLSGAVASLPDFGIYPENVACLNSQPKEGQSPKIEANIFNFGTVGMVNVPVDLYVDSVKVNSGIIGFLPAFANQAMDFSWMATRGTHNITMVVNGGHSIPESDYSNNQAQTSITVLADDVAIANVTYVKNVVGRGFSFNVSVTVVNGGDFTETFNVTAYANTTAIATFTDITLTSGNSTTLDFTWNTSGFAKGNYTISAYAEPVPGETDTADNSITDGLVLITKVGDLGGGVPPAFFNCDGSVDGKDLALFLQCYKGTALPEAMYLGDLGGGVPPQFYNCDGNVDGKDLSLFLQCFKGQGPP